MARANLLSKSVGAALRGAGGGAKEPRSPIESPDSLRSIAFARILDLVSEGEIYGFADQDKPLTCVFLNETPVANDDGSLNFKNIQIESRVGTQTQDYLPNFQGVENEIAVSVELRYETPWTRSITNLDLDAVRIRLSVPALSKVNVSNGDTNGHSVGYRIDVAIDGGPFIQKLVTAFTGKASSKYERTHRIDLPPATTGWTLRVVRTTTQAETATIQDTTVVESFAEIIDAKMRMPMSALVSMIVDAEQFNNIPARAFRLKGRILRVPSNYDPDTRTYTGIWDGTFQSRYSNNPAWVFYDMAQNRRYGLGRYVPSELVDRWNLYRIAQYCDQLVPDGFGGQEPRFTCNLYFQQAADALRVMQDLCTVFRGIIYASGGQITAVGDMPEDPCYTYTPANVIEGKFVYGGSARKVRHTVAHVSWTDLSDFGRAKVEYVPDEAGIIRYGIQPTEVIATGATSRGQARRLGKYILTTERYETDSVVFSVGLDGTVVAPGKIIEIADPLRAGRRTGGRIRLATVNSVAVDQVPVVAPGDMLTVTLPTAVTEKREVLSVVGSVITVTENFSAIPVAQSVWAVESDELKMQLFRVLGVSELSDQLGYAINAVQHVPGKFDFVEEGIEFDELPISVVPGSVVPSPTGLVITPRDVTDQNTTAKIVNLRWTAVPVAVTYQVLWRQSNGSWMDLGKTGANNVDIPNVMPGAFEVQVIAFNSLGVKSVPTFGGPYDIAPVAQPPNYVGDLIDADNALSNAIIAETEAREAAILAEAEARAEALLNEQLAREAAIEAETVLRQSADESLAASISTLSAGTGEQFDSQKVWYFDTDLESWTGNGTPTVTGGFIRPANAASDPYLMSPSGLAVDGSAYKYVKLRINRTGAPVWDASVTGYNAANAVVGALSIDEPEFQADGDATIDFKDIPWSGVVDHVRFVLSEAQTATDYFTIDWIAVGRPTPGASVAALQQEAVARITGDAAEVTQRNLLAAQVRGGYTGTDPTALSAGLIYNERQLRITAEGVIASDVTALEARIENAEDDIDLQATAITSLDARVSAAEGVNTSQASLITALTTRVTNAEGVNTSQAGALTSLDARVTSAEGVNTAQAASITAINATLPGKADASAVTSLTVRVQNVEQGGYGVNLLTNTALLPAANLWEYAAAGGWTAPTINLLGATFVPPGLRNWGSGNPYNAVASTAYINMLTPRVQIAGSSALVGSVFVSLARCRAQIYIQWDDVNGVLIGYSAVGEFHDTGTTGAALGGTNIGSWLRLKIIDVAPSNARFARILVQFKGNGGDIPYGWVMRPMLESKRTDQANPSPWNSGGFEAMAQHTLTLDVNGYVTGWAFTNDGTSGDFAIRADKFSIVAASGGERTEYSNNNWRVYDSAGTLRCQFGVF